MKTIPVIVDDLKINVPLYATDQRTTFVQRIAAKVDSLEKYIYLKPIPDMFDLLDPDYNSSNQSITTSDLLSTIRNSTDLNNLFHAIDISDINEPYPDIDIDHDILVPYMFYSGDAVFDQGDGEIILILRHIYDSFGLEFFSETITDILTDKANYLDKFKQSIHLFSAMVKNQDAPVSSFFNTVPSVVLSQPEVVGTEHKFYIPDFQFEVSDLFEHFFLGSQIYVVLYNDIIRINPVVDLNQQIVTELNSLKVGSNELYILFADPEATTGAITRTEQATTDTTYLRITNEETEDHWNNLIIRTPVNNVDMIYDVFDNIRKLWDSEVKINQSQYYKTVGLIKDVNFTYDPIILRDLIMNQFNLSKLFYINEFNVASKHTTHLRIRYALDKKVSFALAMTPRTSVSINYHTPAELDMMLKVIPILFELYNKAEAQTINMYKSFIPEFKRQQDPVIKSKHKYDFNQKIFGTNYIRRCNNLPLIVADDNKHLYPDYNVITFPKDPMPNIEQQQYTCVGDTHQYIGLMGNKDKTSNKNFPLVPCCFKVPKLTNPNSKISKYYKGEVIDKKRNKSTYRHTTGILDFGQKGVVPDIIHKVLSYNSPDPCQKFTRVGTARSPSSAIEACIRAIDVIRGHSFDHQTPESITDEIDRLRGMSVEDNPLELVYQELFSYELYHIDEYIKNPNLYFNPNTLYRLLENEYNVVIFTFTKTQWMIPPSLMFHVRERLDTPLGVVLIYENETDPQTGYPHCELILADRTTLIDPNFINSLYNMYNKLSPKSVYSFPDTFREYLSRNPFIRFDRFGKVSLIGGVDSKAIGIIDPIALPYKLTPKPFKGYSVRTNVNMAIRELGAMGIEQDDITQIIDKDWAGKDERAIALRGRIGSIRVTFAFNNSVILPYRKEYEYNTYSYGTQLANFRDHKRWSLYFLELCTFQFILFSNQHPDKPFRELLDDYITKYIKIGEIEMIGHNIEALTNNVNHLFKLIGKWTYDHNQDHLNFTFTVSQKIQQGVYYHIMMGIKSDPGFFNKYDENSSTIQIPIQHNTYSVFDGNQLMLELSNIARFNDVREEHNNFEIHTRIEPDMDERYLVKNKLISNGSLVYIQPTNHPFIEGSNFSDYHLSWLAINHPDSYTTYLAERNDMLSVYAYINETTIPMFTLGKGGLVKYHPLLLIYMDSSRVMNFALILPISEELSPITYDQPLKLKTQLPLRTKPPRAKPELKEDLPPPTEPSLPPRTEPSLPPPTEPKEDKPHPLPPQSISERHAMEQEEKYYSPPFRSPVDDLSKSKCLVDVCEIELEDPLDARYFFNLTDEQVNQVRFTDRSLYEASTSDQAYRTADLINTLVSNLKSKIILETSAGIGGNTVELAQVSRKVNAVEISTLTGSILKHNLEVLKIDNVTVHHTSVINPMFSGFFKSADVTFIDAPWGGDNYQDWEIIELVYKGGDEDPVHINDFINTYVESPLVVAKVPLNINMKLYSSDRIQYDRHAVVKVNDRNGKSIYQLLIYMNDVEGINFNTQIPKEIQTDRVNYRTIPHATIQPKHLPPVTLIGTPSPRMVSGFTSRLDDEDEATLRLELNRIRNEGDNEEEDNEYRVNNTLL